ncbi:hypothetical protein NDU88_001098 [Pleurodeles waltl]|uniref:Uncharacterized protein n=1 Tax=Pleurodeles waltl TaxID=8319 RepID=A0AAV7LAH7_PLEWA|nr:hypothetical protein NDU88_001098 [Pleurodeles waltl]
MRRADETRREEVKFPNGAELSAARPCILFFFPPDPSYCTQTQPRPWPRLPFFLFKFNEHPEAGGTGRRPKQASHNSSSSGSLAGEGAMPCGG